jgi:glycosyltransferase involved in cell wall biosynthesis
VVSVDVGDVRERIETIAGCVLCEDDDPETLAGAIETVLSDTRPFDGRRQVDHLDERSLCRKLVTIYHEVLRP